VNIAFTPEQEAFRAEVQVFLSDYTELNGFFAQGQKWAEVKAFFQAMGQRGWLSLAWPESVGGMGRSPVDEFILWDEMGYTRAARPPLAPGIVAKTIIAHGSDEQKQRFLPGIASGELQLSLGYSEPEAGSDLASLRTRAALRGDRYIVTGEKCWTSYAQDADYLWLLARTGTQESRGRGLSLLILDLHAPGVSVNPLPTLDDEQLNEIHLEGAEVPVENRVGPENGAWKLVAEALAVERHVQFPPKRLRRDLEDIVAWLREIGLERDAVVQRRLAELVVELYEVEMHALRVLEALEKGRSSTVEAACNKLAWTTTCQNIARAALDFGGPEGLVKGTMVEFLWRQSMWESIGGGTSEVMRGVIARQALGLS